MRNCDKFKLEVMSPWDEGESWAREWSDEDVRAARILINGKDFMDIMNGIEFKKRGVMYAYGHSEFADQELVPEGSRTDSFRPFCCSDCGMTGCCGFSGQIRMDEKYVYWEHFTSPGIKEYGCSFRFAKDRYLKEVKRFRKGQRKKAA